MTEFKSTMFCSESLADRTLSLLMSCGLELIRTSREEFDACLNALGIEADYDDSGRHAAARCNGQESFVQIIKNHGGLASKMALVTVSGDEWLTIAITQMLISSGAKVLDSWCSRYVIYNCTSKHAAELGHLFGLKFGSKTYGTEFLYQQRFWYAQQALEITVGPTFGSSMEHLGVFIGVTRPDNFLHGRDKLRTAESFGRILIEAGADRIDDFVVSRSLKREVLAAFTTK